jgi:hypothetical protein
VTLVASMFTFAGSAYSYGKELDVSVYGKHLDSYNMTGWYITDIKPVDPKEVPWSVQFDEGDGWIEATGAVDRDTWISTHADGGMHGDSQPRVLIPVGGAEAMMDMGNVPAKSCLAFTAPEDGNYTLGGKDGLTFGFKNWFWGTENSKADLRVTINGKAIAGTEQSIDIQGTKTGTIPSNYTVNLNKGDVVRYEVDTTAYNNTGWGVSNGYVTVSPTVTVNYGVAIDSKAPSTPFKIKQNEKVSQPAGTLSSTLKITDASGSKTAASKDQLSLSMATGTFETNAGGSIKINQDGSFEYTPKSGYNGEDRYDVIVTVKDASTNTNGKDPFMTKALPLIFQIGTYTPSSSSQASSTSSDVSSVTPLRNAVDVQFACDKQTVKSGDTIAVSVKALPASRNIAAFGMNVKYDTNLLEYQSTKAAFDLGSDSDFVTRTQSDKTIYVMYVSGSGQGDEIAFDAEGNASHASLFEMTFKVKTGTDGKTATFDIDTANDLFSIANDTPELLNATINPLKVVIGEQPESSSSSSSSSVSSVVSTESSDASSADNEQPGSSAIEEPVSDSSTDIVTSDEYTPDTTSDSDQVANTATGDTALPALGVGILVLAAATVAICGKRKNK